MVHVIKQSKSPKSSEMGGQAAMRSGIATDMPERAQICEALRNNFLLHETTSEHITGNVLDAIFNSRKYLEMIDSVQSQTFVMWVKAFVNDNLRSSYGIHRTIATFHMNKVDWMKIYDWSLTQPEITGRPIKR